MHEVPPSITGTFMPTSYKSDLEETLVTFASVPVGSRNSSASISASRFIPGASNRPAYIHAGRHIPASRSVRIGWTNHAARPFFRTTNLYFDNVSWPGIYDHVSMNEGK
uniref:Uncharacterized protein n=1 Tax=Tanacetum cinerariifolium TaxID=118510 RepID=A0A699TIC3_TANCI|nr:hypothetical protein [Tanacetum cinerariifolium]